jgi:ATP-binding cassette subfamily B multidrug efflux pump
MKIVEAYKRWRDDYRVFRFYFRKYRKYYLFGILSLVVVDGLEAVPPLLLMHAVNGVTEMKYGPELRSLLLRLSFAYLGIALIQGCMRFLWRRFIIRTSMFSSHDMRQELFVHLSSMAPGFFQKKRVGDLVSLATNDIEAVRFSLGPGALLLFDCLFYFLAIPPIMLWISPQLTLVAFVPLLVVPFFVRRMEGAIQTRFREVQDLFALLASNCQEALSGIRVVKGAALERAKEKEFKRLGVDYQNANMRSAKTQAFLTAGLEGILSASTGLLFLMGGAYVIGDKISLGVFVAFQRYIGKMAWPMEGIGLAANIFQRSLASQKRVDEVLQQKPFLSSQRAERALTGSEVPAIRVQNLSYKYPGSEKAVLQNISFELPPGMRLGIAGGVGSGKSTLLACLSRMLPVEAGSILFNGTDVVDLALGEIRSRIAFVPQESFLFSRSVEENILYGSPDFFEKDPDRRRFTAERAAELAAMGKDIPRLASGFETLLGERGTNLSGGQRQRMTIARAIARSPRVMLLDDCMSAIDSETERRLVRGILEATQGISLVVASHRVSTFHDLDWMIVLDEGKIVSQGKPRDLLGENEILRGLARRQEIAELDILT